jgi:hypothetical protein
VPDTISSRALNRATLARQLLLHRADLPAIDAIEHLVGMQAQAPLAPYVGLWSRLGSFRPAELAGLIAGRQAVRLHLMRTTVHLVSARDAVMLAPLLRGVHERAFATGSPFGPRLAGVDLAELVAEGVRLLGEQPPAGPGMTRSIWPTRSATWFRWSRSRREASGGSRRGPRGGRPPRCGWIGPSTRARGSRR